MKIRNVSCRQFAGVRNQNVAFTDGINVVFGNNESGKSTLVNLLSRTLFQDAKLNKSRKSDKEFSELYFPSKKKNGIAGDFVDGTVEFETSDGQYALYKEWGTQGRVQLSTPDGEFRDPGKINELMKDVLVYGEGVYTDLLMTSQQNMNTSLQTLLDASQKTETKQEITELLSQAFVESDGISMDVIEQAIAKKVEEIGGKHWDFDRDMPVFNRSGRWSKDRGQILNAYYQMEDAHIVLQELSRREKEADRTSRNYLDKDAEVVTAREACDRFSSFVHQLMIQNERRKTVERLDKELQKINDVLSRWPDLKEKLEKAKQLKTERNNRLIRDMWQTVNALQTELSDEDVKNAALQAADRVEIAIVEKAQREIAMLENQLCGMNLKALIHMMGNHEIELVSLRTGKKLELDGDLASITEAVQVIIPGVMEMTLTAANVDVDQINERTAQCKEAIKVIFEKYEVETLEELHVHTQKVQDAKAKVERVNMKMARALGDLTLEQLKELVEKTEAVDRTKEQIESDVYMLTRGLDLTTFMTRTETVMDGFVQEYGSANDLKAKAFDLSMELLKAKETVSASEVIPSEYRGIADPQRHLETLQMQLKNKTALREQALTEKTASLSRFEDYKDAHPEACRETVEKAQEAFEETKSLLHHWRHIQEVFNKQKECLQANPMDDIAKHFNHYLDVISSNHVSSEFPDSDKLNMNIYSNDRLLSYQKLSEGTKDTVALAFRLAVLDHLFPNGDGIIVFDDPFTDMDSQRTAQACELLKECAKKHQVIFLTCKEEYLDLLSGNIIQF